MLKTECVIHGDLTTVLRIGLEVAERYGAIPRRRSARRPACGTAVRRALACDWNHGKLSQEDSGGATSTDK